MNLSANASDKLFEMMYPPQYTKLSGRGRDWSLYTGFHPTEGAVVPFSPSSDQCIRGRFSPVQSFSSSRH